MIPALDLKINPSVCFQEIGVLAKAALDQMSIKP